jgi:hypothetical protein
VYLLNGTTIRFQHRTKHRPDVTYLDVTPAATCLIYHHEPCRFFTKPSTAANIGTRADPPGKSAMTVAINPSFSPPINGVPECRISLVCSALPS